MTDAPEIRWTVYVRTEDQLPAEGLNFGEGATPDEALASLRRRWEYGRKHYDDALAMLDQAVREGVTP